MPLVNTQQYFDHDNNGWIYIAQDQNGIYWERSVQGKYAQIDAPVDVTVLSTDFDLFQGKNTPAMLSDLTIDNQGASKDAIA